MICKTETLWNICGFEISNISIVSGQIKKKKRMLLIMDLTKVETISPNSEAEQVILTKKMNVIINVIQPHRQFMYKFTFRAAVTLRRVCLMSPKKNNNKKKKFHQLPHRSSVNIS